MARASNPYMCCLCTSAFRREMTFQAKRPLQFCHSTAPRTGHASQPRAPSRKHTAHTITMYSQAATQPFTLAWQMVAVHPGAPASMRMNVAPCRFAICRSPCVQPVQHYWEDALTAVFWQRGVEILVIHRRAIAAHVSRWCGGCHWCHYSTVYRECWLGLVGSLETHSLDQARFLARVQQLLTDNAGAVNSAKWLYVSVDACVQWELCQT